MKTTSKNFEINGRTFSIGMLPAIEAVKVEVAVARVIGEPLFKAFVAAKDSKESVDEAAAGAAAIGLLLSKMDSTELLNTMATVFAYVTCDAQRIELNSTFTGRNKELWQVFIAALQFNFEDFFPDNLLASLPSVKPKGLKS